jgi:hypothetical protein
METIYLKLIVKNIICSKNLLDEPFFVEFLFDIFQLRVREHPTLGPYVEGLSTYVVNSFDDVKGWITLGNKNRATAATGMNDKSSRSHSVFTLVLTQTKV